MPNIKMLKNRGKLRNSVIILEMVLPNLFIMGLKKEDND